MALIGNHAVSVLILLQIIVYAESRRRNKIRSDRQRVFINSINYINVIR